MPEPFTTHKDNVFAAWGHLFADFHNAVNHLESLADQLDGEDCPNSAQSVRLACVDFRKFEQHIKGGTPSMRTTFRYCLDWLDENWPTDGDPYELTMSKILDTLWKAEGGQPLLFINYIDAMRGSVSEKTVYAPYLRSLLRHFQ